MVDAVEEEVEEHGPILVGKVVVDMEQEAVEGVLEDSPDNNAEGKARNGGGPGGGGGRRESADVEREKFRGIDSALSVDSVCLAMTQSSRTYRSVNWSRDSTKRNTVIGPQNSGMTYHFVRVNDYSLSGSVSRWKLGTHLEEV